MKITTFFPLILAACSAVPSSPDQAMQVQTLMTSGTCFPISDTDYLTAWHVVKDSPFITVDGEPVDQVIRLEGLDGALLRFLDGHGHAPWLIDETPLRAGERLWLSGYGAGHHWFTQGISAGGDRVSISICPGDSGGPLQDEQGEVRGIVMAQGLWAQHHTWIIPIRDLMDAIRLESKNHHPILVPR